MASSSTQQHERGASGLYKGPPLLRVEHALGTRQHSTCGIRVALHGLCGVNVRGGLKSVGYERAGHNVKLQIAVGGGGIELAIGNAERTAAEDFTGKAPILTRIAVGGVRVEAK
jgi:hypothetical protein